MTDRMLNFQESVAAGLITDEAAPSAWSPLTTIHDTFRRWLGEDYDLAAVDATLATAAVERLDGDPLWLLLISGSGNAKTETVQSLDGVGALVVSTISSEAAFLSGTPSKQRTKGATGGLLRQIGDRGLLVIKDVTSLLSMNRDTRATVFAALREIHDGRWVRTLGTDGGRSLPWAGRITVVGAVTTAWDRAHDVIAALGDRFVLLRIDSTEGRAAAGRQSRRNVGHEQQMRSELAAAVAGVLEAADLDGDLDVTDDEAETLLAAADLVTLARTGVDYDYRGDVIDAHAPEMPTRFMKELVQLVRGALAVGMHRHDALRLAIRCARDSMPPLRLAILDDLAEHPCSTPTDVRRRLGKPRATVHRQLQSLHILGVLRLDEEERADGKASWRYSLGDGIDPAALRPLPDLSPHTHKHTEKRGAALDVPSTPSDISGNGREPPDERPRCEVCGEPVGDGQTVHSRCRYELDDGTVVEQPRLLDRPTGGSYTEPVEMPPQAEWLTPAQARKYVGEIGTTEDRDGFAHLCDIGEGPPGVRFGGGIRYQRTEVDAWLTSRAADHDPDEGET